MADNAGEVTRYESRPAEVSLDPAMLDAHRENDHATEWEQSPPSRAVGYALLIFVLGAATAAVAFGWWPFA